MAARRTSRSPPLDEPEHETVALAFTDDRGPALPKDTASHDLWNHYASLLIRHGDSVKVVQKRRPRHGGRNPRHVLTPVARLRGPDPIRDRLGFSGFSGLPTDQGKVVSGSPQVRAQAADESACKPGSGTALPPPAPLRRDCALTCGNGSQHLPSHCVAYRRLTACGRPGDGLVEITQDEAVQLRDELTRWIEATT
jgi:hypothetical protein